MANNDNQSKHIYLKSERQWVEVSNEYYQDYTRMNCALRKRMQYHHRCSCPRKKWWLCDGDCDDCAYQITTNDYISLDYIISDDDGSEKSMLYNISDPAQDFCSIQEDCDLLNALLEILDTLCPEDRRICDQIMSGKSERECARELNMPRNTYVYRKNKALGTLRERIQIALP